VLQRQEGLVLVRAWHCVQPANLALRLLVLGRLWKVESILRLQRLHGQLQGGTGAGETRRAAGTRPARLAGWLIVLVLLFLLLIQANQEQAVLRATAKGTPGTRRGGPTANQ